MTGEEVTPVPVGFGIALDPPTTVRRRGAVLLGGSPRRMLRLSPNGRRALHELQAGTVTTTEAGIVARRLLRSGLAHPRPPKLEQQLNVMTIIPVRDRVAELDQCLRAMGGDHPVVVVDDGSLDPAEVAATSRRHGAALVTRPVTGGPAAARNTGLQAVDLAKADAIAFLDSDCIPSPGWLDTLTTHFADPVVGAVAPRVTPTGGDAGTPAAAYTTARSPLDLGPSERRVEPGSRVSYVPTAAVVVRTAALQDPAFDGTLRYGEDVDAIWRMIDAGWDVRYVPSTVVSHTEPSSRTALLARRYRYGTSAGPLARRHPTRLAPFMLQPWPAAVCASMLARRPRAAAALAGMATVALARRLRRVGAPPALAGRMTAQAVVSTLLGASRATAQLGVPTAALAASVRSRGRTRRLAMLGLVLAVPHVGSWFTAQPSVGLVPWVATGIADDAAYGAGVWRGAWQARTWRPLIPVMKWNS